MAFMKALYSLTIASELLKLHPRTIMNYEKLGFVRSKRSPTNRRLFSNKDLELLLFIKYLREKEKLNIPAIKLVLKEGLRNLFPNFDPKKRLQEILSE